MAKPRAKKIRPTYRAHSDEVIQSDIRNRVPQGCPFFDWLTEIRLNDVEGGDEYTRGIYEGMRRLSRQIQDFVMAEEQKPSE